LKAPEGGLELNCEWQMANGELQMANGRKAWRIANGELQMAN
jgi:hypothetical protein